MDGGVAVDDHGAFGNATYVEGRTRKDTALDGTDALNVTGARKGVRLPASVTRHIRGARERGVCLWARVDRWRKAALFGYGTATTGESATAAPAKPGAFGLAVDDDAGFVALDFGDGYPVKTELPARAGQWHHYCLVYDDGNATLYYDSVMSKTTRIALNTTNGSPFHLGAGLNGADALDGSIDEVYIYELDQYYDSASLAEVMDVSGAATELLSLPENSEAATDTGGNLADDLLVGGSASTIFYDDTSL